MAQTELRRIRRVLVANRGEIAIRVFRACHDLGLRTIGIYSKEDMFNLFRTKADEAYLIEADSPLGAYLDIDQIIRLAKEKGVDAIHPGYGFLSENAAFARACEENGILFVGPPSGVLEKMGDKLNAKKIALACGVPTIPGSKQPLTGVQEALDRAEEYGYPVLLKAAAGGGGRGMRRVNDPGEMAAALEMVTGEAVKAFGSSEIFMEKYLEEPKHIEVQVLGDGQGNLVHLFERDCSLQRRYQKVVEFTPAFSLDTEIRSRLYEDALKIARQVGYVSAGTVEFLVDKHGSHYFIEMNPRIQVEHTVTEEVTGIDIVRAQLLIAEGLPLSTPSIGIRSQTDVSMRGYAIQCRITTEDPANNFAPDTGKLTAYRSGGGNGVRLDAGNAFTGAEITPYYDSLLVKITAHDNSFLGAVRKALRSVGEVRVRGVKTNIRFLTNILENPVFQSGACSTQFIDETPELFVFGKEGDRATKVLMHIGDVIVNHRAKQSPQAERPTALTVAGEPEPGLKQMLDEKGPEAVGQWVLQQKKLLVCDTTFRDAHQSLLATRVRTRDLLGAAEMTARVEAGAFSLEMWGGATFDVAYRYLHEDPWERMRLLRGKIPNLLFQMLLRGANAVGYSNYPDNVIRDFVRQAAQSGVDVFRIFDSLNWLPGMETAIDEALKTGKLVEPAICYTGDILDPTREKYTLKYYVGLAKELERRGAHVLAIKDMAGLLKPYAAKRLVEVLKQEVGIPINLHTHDTSGNQVASVLLAAQAGVDIADLAIASMSSLTSQPSLNAVAAALEGTERDMGMHYMDLQPLTEYWQTVRSWYAPYESGLKSPATEIYRYEIPGGQYTNLKPQVKNLGLGNRFAEVKEMYRRVNDMLGDIVKVTPSSKVVGDLAIFMVQNDLTPENILQKGKDLNYPDSTISYFSGMMGQPAWGFDAELQKIVLKGQKPITCRPGELLPPVNYDEVRQALQPYVTEPTMEEILSYVMYPKVVEEYYQFRNKFGDLSTLETPVFFNGMAQGETTTMTIDEGKTLIIRYIGLGEANEDGTRQVVFELNGVRREITIKDESAKATGKAVIMANPDNLLETGASIQGMVSKLLVRQGDAVHTNDVLAIVEAMKMETSVVARCDGVVDQIFAESGQTVKAGELLVRLRAE